MRHRTALTIVGATSLTMSGLEALLPNQLSFYDTGVYLDQAALFVGGHLPYTSYWDVQPPGYLPIWSPLGLIAHLTNWPTALTAARIVAALTIALCAILAANIARHYGTGATIAAGLLFALAPVTQLEATSLKIEAPMIALILYAAHELFNKPPSDRATRRAGIALGIAASIKLWAFFPFAAALIALGHHRRAQLRLTAIAGATFTLVVLPFAATAPANFITGVFLDQLHRRALPNEILSIPTRLLYLDGNTSTSHLAAAATTIAALTIAAILYRRARNHTMFPIERFLLTATILDAGALLYSTESYPYYFILTAATITPLIAIATHNLWQQPLHRIAGAAIAGALAAGTYNTYSETAYTHGFHQNWFAAIDKHTTPGSCIIYSEITEGIAANRMPNPDTCPIMPDSYGEWMQAGYHVTTPPPWFVAHYIADAQQATYMIEPTPHNLNWPWQSATFRAYMHRNYRMTYAGPGVRIFAHKTQPAASLRSLP